MLTSTTTIRTRKPVKPATTTPIPTRKGRRKITRPRPRPIANPRDGWPSWTDQRWTSGPEPTLAPPVAFVHPEYFRDAPAGMYWMAITPYAGVLRDLPSAPAVEPVDEPRPTAPADYEPTPIEQAEAALILNARPALSRRTPVEPHHCELIEGAGIDVARAWA